MRAVVQRVSSARVTVGDRVTGEIGVGLLALVGVEKGDSRADVEYIASKIRDLRIFEDDGEPSDSSTLREPVGRSEPSRARSEFKAGRRMNRSVVDIGGSVLVVSQFTLVGDVRRGRRPSFDGAAPPEVARLLYEDVVRELRGSGLSVATGEFQARMSVQLENDGPVTIVIDSRGRL